VVLGVVAAAIVAVGTAAVDNAMGDCGRKAAAARSLLGAVL